MTLRVFALGTHHNPGADYSILAAEQQMWNSHKLPGPAPVNQALLPRLPTTEPPQRAYSDSFATPPDGIVTSHFGPLIQHPATFLSPRQVVYWGQTINLKAECCYHFAPCKRFAQHKANTLQQTQHNSTTQYNPTVLHNTKKQSAHQQGTTAPSNSIPKQTKHRTDTQQSPILQQLRTQPSCEGAPCL